MENDSSNNGKITNIIIIAVFVLAGLIGAWYWFMYLPKQEAIERARLEQIAKQRAQQKRAEEAARKKARYEQLIEEANAAFAEERWEDAQSAYSEAASLFPKQQYPKDQLEIVTSTLDEIAAREARKAAGEVEKVSSATGRYYVIVSSSIDGDLAMDFGTKMAKEGESVKIIEPYGSNKFYRISFGDYGSYEEAAGATSAFNSTSGDPIWVLKY